MQNQQVEEYRAYFLGLDGHFNGYEPLICRPGYFARPPPIPLEFLHQAWRCLASEGASAECSLFI
jgi:hypothetical protein